MYFIIWKTISLKTNLVNYVVTLCETSSEILDTIVTRLGNVEGANAPAVIGSNNNNNNQRNVQKNENYNEGLVRKRKLYNYRVAANYNYRNIELFILLNSIFSFCDEVNRIHKYILYKIVLTRLKKNTY